MQSFVAPVAAEEWPEDRRSALVAQEAPRSVEPITGITMPGSGCWHALETATVRALTLLVQPNHFGAHPSKAVRNVVRTSYKTDNLNPRWTWSGPYITKVT